jgi:hypothetical protein
MNCTERLADAGMSVYIKKSIYIIRRWKGLFYLHKHTKLFLYDVWRNALKKICWEKVIEQKAVIKFHAKVGTSAWQMMKKVYEDVCREQVF